MESKKGIQLIEAAKKGDDKAFSELCHLHRGYIIGIAKEALVKSKVHNFNIDDLIHAGNIAILKAIKKYDFEKGFTFLTYAGRGIEKAIKDEIQLQTEFDKERNYQIDSLDAEKYVNLTDSDAKSPDSFMNDIVSHPKAAKILEEQPKIIKKIIELYYGLDENISGKRTMKEIADELGISVKKVKSTKEDIEFQIKQSVFFDHLAY